LAEAITSVPPAPSRRDIVTIVAAVLTTVILSALDQTVVTPALPAITRELHGLEHLSWIVSAYLLTSTALTLVYGKLSDIHGRRGLMLFAIVVFVGSSLICALAQNIPQLIAARALQGAGAGGLLVTAQATMADLVSPRERARYQVYVTSTFALASAGGPPLGGFLVDHLSWRWVFWVNLPIGIIAYLICRRVPAFHIPQADRRIDYLGLGLLVLTATAVLVLVSWGGSTYPWTSLPVLGCAVVAIAAGVGFVVREQRTDAPVFPPRLLRNRTIQIGDLAVFLIAMLMLGAIVLVPVFLQLVMTVGAGSSGALLVPMLLGLAIASTCASQTMRRTGRYKALLPVGLSFAIAAYVLFATLTATSPQHLVAFALLLLGLGIGTCVPTINVAVQNSADPRDLGVTVSTVTFARSLGGAFGAAVFWALFLGFLSAALSAAGLTGLRSLLFDPGGAALAGIAAGDRAAVVAALTGAFHHTFLFGAAIAVFALFAVLSLKEETLKTTRPRERDLEAAGA
jgi:EmrB/QacA subfamily drug resistance transporter